MQLNTLVKVAAEARKKHAKNLFSALKQRTADDDDDDDDEDSCSKVFLCWLMLAKDRRSFFPFPM